MRVANSRFNRNYRAARLRNGTLRRFWAQRPPRYETGSKPPERDPLGQKRHGEGTRPSSTSSGLPSISQQAPALAAKQAARGEYVTNLCQRLYGEGTGVGYLPRCQPLPFNRLLLPFGSEYYRSLIGFVLGGRTLWLSAIE